MDIIAKLAFEIYFIEGKQSLPADQLSRSAREVAVNNDEADKQAVKQFFCKPDNWGLEMVEVNATIDRNCDLKECLKVS